MARAQVDMVSAIRGYKPKQPHLALEMSSTFVPMRVKGKRNKDEFPVEESKETFKDDEFYLPYSRKDNFAIAEERGYSVKEGSFASQANQAVFDLGFSDDLKKTKNNLPKNAKNMDRQKFNALANQKRIKTEHGTSVPASFKTDIYQKWQRKTRMQLPQVGDVELGSDKLASLAPKKRWVTRKKSKNPSSGPARK